MTGITLAVPSKGRLEELTREWFAANGLVITRPGGARSYLGAIEGLPEVTVRFFPASEIARELIRGNVDFGVTGRDLIHETSETGPQSVAIARPLGFGNADVVVAVPDAWIDVTRMHDLADVASDFRSRHGRWLRIATKYITITRQHFARFGIAEYRIVESLGATEAAPASGVADIIVDITTTGSTLTANALRVLEDGVLLQSEACLIVSRTAKFSARRRAQLDSVLSRLGAEVSL
ncbi:ATP phosphoribosyltransferase catalytic subunit [Devosia limi DSM 17137]|uniref:ATP phosphoribosyltransferase n=1 Tax=Devosia limi DSM 17137 TaxID=1121477 RepID=A0A0F5LUS6_9HYPH|nr:ATP phosphoribosyltransferase [Devosia limi]KKB86026.1 ATP phosphoribosyltransferase catalytic subunit [Devosia limi DSM 17137]SHG00685.1 ATP phosphoribosyltransferase [Devosia limi DSM 17137]